MTSPIALRARTLVRRSGLSKTVMRWLRSRGYEEALTGAMMKATRPGDTIWDVGANIGEYAAKFAEWTGPIGKVYAFEPALDTVQRLTQAVRPFTNVTVVPQGLSDKAGEIGFIRDDHPDGATFRVAGPKDPAPNATVRLSTGDELVSRGEAQTPNLIKIDIEGHELESLLGMQAILAGGQARHIFIEVHFFLLTPQGRDDVPGRIEKLLQQNGYRVGWVDQSHIHARLRTH